MLHRNVLLYGKEAEQPAPIPLRAGPVDMIFVDGDLRYLRYNGLELLRRVYAAVRDRNWGTIPATVSKLKLDAGDDRFKITYVADHIAGPIHFRWQALIEGSDDGTVTYSMDGKALTTFLRNRIGLCVHHPVLGFAGQPCVIETTDGQSLRATTPAAVSPHQPFRSIRAVTHQAAPGVQAELRFEGEVFEMEDHRNWTDASFKTYGTPLDLPFPVEVAGGTVLQQTVRFRLVDRAARPSPSRPSPARITLDGAPVSLPRIGLSACSSGWNPSPQHLDRLRRLRLSHLRVDATALSPDPPPELALGLPLEISLLASADAETHLTTAAAVARQRNLAVARWLVLDAASPVTTEATAALARKILGAAPLAGGTRGPFADLNRNRPPAGRFDCLAFAASPQVHAADNLTLAENPAAFRDVFATAKSFAAGAPVYISPLTLRVQFNPAATSAAAPVAPGTLPPDVDPRQMSLIAAGYTAAAFKHLAEAAAAGVTFYETAGWKGVMETAEGSPLPAAFPSLPGSVFPVWHLLADLAEFRDGQVLPSRSSHPLQVEALALRVAGFTRLIVVNLSATQQSVEIPGELASLRRHVRLLDAASAEAAMANPEAFRSPLGQATLHAPASRTLLLDAYAMATLDFVTEGSA